MVVEVVGTRDGRALHLERSGTGSPIVVFEAGMGASRNEWGLIAPRVAERTEVALYDRSGLGRSAPADGPRDLDALVADHLDVLDHLGDGPFVLVAHSWGGPIVRCAAAWTPERIAGLVLVDQTDEGCDLYFTKGNERQARWFERALPVLARLGLVRMTARRLAAPLPEPHASQMVAEDTSPTALRAHRAEAEGSLADLRGLRDDPPQLPDVPTVLISGTKAGRFEGERRTALVAAHRARAEAAPQGRHVEAPSSGHHVPLTDPDVVVDEILRLL